MKNFHDMLDKQQSLKHKRNKLKAKIRSSRYINQQDRTQLAALNAAILTDEQMHNARLKHRQSKHANKTT